ncbi:hypothetical protein KKH27_06990 [bacterium]|nr:hypothetical protein [bacterium]MBU1983463.1 hypothetical protein [bacterium]
MTHLHLWCSLKADADAREFCDNVQEFLSDLYRREMIEGFNIARRDFAMDPPGLGEFHFTVDFRDARQASRTLDEIEKDDGEIAEFRKTVTAVIKDMNVAMYRDWPEPRLPRINHDR